MFVQLSQDLKDNYTVSLNCNSVDGLFRDIFQNMIGFAMRNISGSFLQSVKWNGNHFGSTVGHISHRLIYVNTTPCHTIINGDYGENMRIMFSISDMKC